MHVVTLALASKERTSYCYILECSNICVGMYVFHTFQRQYVDMDQQKEQNIADLLSTIRAGDQQAPPPPSKSYHDAFDNTEDYQQPSTSSHHKGSRHGQSGGDARGRKGRDMDMRQQYKSKGEARWTKRESKNSVRLCT